MKNISKLEFVIPEAFLDQALKCLESAGIGGYTAVEVRRGKGLQSGENRLEGMLSTSRNVYVFSIAENTQSKAAYAEIEKLLKRIGGFVLITNVENFATSNQLSSAEHSDQ